MRILGGYLPTAFDYLPPTSDQAPVQASSSRISVVHSPGAKLESSRLAGGAGSDCLGFLNSGSNRLGLAGETLASTSLSFVSRSSKNSRTIHPSFRPSHEARNSNLILTSRVATIYGLGRITIAMNPKVCEGRDLKRPGCYVMTHQATHVLCIIRSHSLIY